MPRLGRIAFDLGYVVDLDNNEMIEDAKVCILEDIENAIKFGELDQYLEVQPAPDNATEADIPEFLIHADEEHDDHV
jgi:hypothetical protein